ncbi:MAG: alpha/beta hydrolase [Muribaculaceae bacterium]|nr:alpha/beta hydrolase [Muribaculaceae bacterium]
MKKTILSIISVMISALAFAQPPGFKMPEMPQPDFADLNYAGDDLEGHKLDIYLPKDGKDKHKLIVVIYGSAWFSNNFKNAAYMSLGKPLNDAGFAVATINHRSSGDAKYPAQINDVKGAIRYLRANADKFGLDTSFVGITGFSSGGHLSAMAGVTNGMKERTVGTTTIDIEGNVGGNTDQSSSVDAVVDWFGPVDMARMENCETVKGADSPEAALIGGAPADNMEMIALISPITYVSETTAPTLVIHGTSDSVVPFCQSDNFSDELAKAGKLDRLIQVEGGEHGPVTFNATTFKSMVDFFSEQAGK